MARDVLGTVVRNGHRAVLPRELERRAVDGPVLFAPDILVVEPNRANRVAARIQDEAAHHAVPPRVACSSDRTVLSRQRLARDRAVEPRQHVERAADRMTGCIHCRE